MKKTLLAITFLMAALLVVASGCAPTPTPIETDTPAPASETPTLAELTTDQKQQLTRIALNRLGLSESRPGEYRVARYGWMSATPGDTAVGGAATDRTKGTVSPGGGVTQLYPGVVLQVGSPPGTEFVVVVNLDTQTVVSVSEHKLQTSDTPAYTPGQGLQGGGATVTAGGSQLAEDFIRNDATFRFDGMAETLKLRAAALSDGAPATEFVYEFESRHAGYGDRAGMIVAQVITPHAVRIRVKDGKVVSALMDDKWDMITQRFVNN